MKKIAFITIIACVSLFFLQGIWIIQTYDSYKKSLVKKLEDSFAFSISEEYAIRSNNNKYQRKKRQVTYKYAKDMTEEERQKYKGGDTLDVSLLNNNAVGHSLEDVILQIGQDILMERDNNPLRLPLLDSIFIDNFSPAVAHGIVSFNRNMKVMESTGNCNMKGYNIVSTKLFPIGTKGLQYIQLTARIPLNNYLKNMFFILVSSVLIMAIVLWILLYQLTTIKKEDELLIARETSINGTIHDLKSPLGSALTLLGWIGGSEKDIEKKEMIESAHKRIQHIVEDIEQILTVAKAEGHNKFSINKIELKPDELIKAAIEKVPVSTMTKPHQLIISDTLSPDIIQGDEMYLENILKNLIENSLKYSDKDVIIHLNLFNYKDAMTVIEVQDNGWGIDKRQQKKIFKQYYQVERKGKRTNGYGIGLSYVKYLVKAHGGSVTLNSSPGKGTDIKCYLPLN